MVSGLARPTRADNPSQVAGMARAGSMMSKEAEG